MMMKTFVTASAASNRHATFQVDKVEVNLIRTIKGRNSDAR
jgi:hypothetical protein